MIYVWYCLKVFCAKLFHYIAASFLRQENHLSFVPIE